MVNLLLAVIYFAFISLGLPDSLLGAAWPSMYTEFNVPVSYAGAISMIISAGTVVSSLMSDRLTRLLGAGRVTAISVAMTAAALLGFSFSSSFWMLCVLAVPYGLGAGSVDAALNNYVALHYASKHMSWLHCMWGVGTTVGPYVMGYALSNGGGWNSGYRYISVIQIVFTAVLVISLPLWKKRGSEASLGGDGGSERPLSLAETVRLPGAPEVMTTFFCYCAAEATVILWASSYMHLKNGVSEDTAATLASIFFIGLTLGRLLNGFLTAKLSDTQLIRAGQTGLLLGILIMLLPLGKVTSFIGITLFGLGCAPIYPCIIHSTPERFGAERSQAMIGIQMASAYVGTTLMPPVFGLIAEHISITLFPIYLLIITLVMILMHERLVRITGKNKSEGNAA